MNLIEYADREMMMMVLAGKLAGELGAMLRQQGHASLCVPGGTTPGPVFDLLSAVDMDWANVAVFLNDERWVDEDNPRSNTRLLRQRLLQGHAAAAQLIPIYAPVPEPEDALEMLSDGLSPHLPISVLLLGMGLDMHTASLFPGADRLEEALSPDAPHLLPMRAEGAEESRITLTAPVLQAAMHTHILITGADKRAAIERAANLPEAEAPIRIALAHATIHWAE